MSVELGPTADLAAAACTAVNVVCGAVMIRMRAEFASRQSVEARASALTLRVEELNGDVKALSVEISGLRDLLARVERPLQIMIEHEIRK